MLLKWTGKSKEIRHIARNVNKPSEMNKTSIDWPGLGYTWNPIVGCANGCTYCYARKISNRFKMIPDFSKPQYFPERIADPCGVKKPATIFVGSMCDIFSEGVNWIWIENIIDTVERCPQHTFMFLTKKPVEYLQTDWPVNCWLGVSIEKKSLWLRMAYMDALPNKKFVSIEPILSDFTGLYLGVFDLVILGADSSKGAKIPPLEWVKSVHHRNIWYKRNILKHYPELDQAK